MRTFTLLKTVIFLIMAVGPARLFGAEQPEPSQSYVYAESRIPNFNAERKPEEGWLLDPTPKSWPKVSLDGKWKIQLTRIGGFVDYFNLDKNFGIEGMPQAIDPAHCDFSAWENTDVPLPMSQLTSVSGAGNPDKPGYIASYQRSFIAPEFKKGMEAVYLKFHGAGFRTDVWIDGSYLGSHLGNFAPFAFDVTPFLQPGKTASLLVKCVDSRYTMRWNNQYSSGITAPVELEIRNIPFADKIRLSSDLAAGKVNGQFELAGNVSAAKAEVFIEEAKSGKQVGTFHFDAKKGGPNSFSIKLDPTHCWSTEDPFLYFCKIKLDGKDAGISRFGFRTMELKADEEGRRHFYLNGKKLYLRMFEFNTNELVGKSLKALPIASDAWSLNNQGRIREALLALKFCNVNALRQHSGNQEMDETFLNLCDELGFIEYLDWTGSEWQRVTPKKESEGFDSGTGGGQGYRIPMMEKTLPSFKEAIIAFHNHPSLCLISFGNELFEQALSSGSFDEIIEKYKAALHEVDLQKRPTSGSAGRPTYKHNAKVDFVDDHQYIGVYYGLYQTVVPYIKNTSAAIKGKFGINLPFINSETGYVSDDRVHPDVQQIFGSELKNDLFDKDLFIKTITGNSDSESWARLGLNGGGVRYWYTDLPEFKKRKATLHVKRYLEMFRMNRKNNDGVSLNTPIDELAAYSDPDNWWGVSINPWPQQGKLALIDPIYAFREGFYPVQAFVGVENYHLLSGGSTKAPIMIVNDSLSDAVIDLKVQLRSADGSVLPLLEKSGIAVPQSGDLSIPFELTIPENYPSGKAVLETYLLTGGKKIAENSYDIFTLAAGDRLTKFPAVKLALYDTAGETFSGFGGKTTGGILESLKIPFTPIKDFQDLADYQVLVIGANSLDETLAKSGAEIAAWIAAGGRLLMFEQLGSGAIPWSGGDHIYRKSPGSFMEIYAKKHPAFLGIENEMAWESPMGNNRALFDNCLELNDSFLSVAAVSHYTDPAAPKAIITDRKSGKGEYLISMVKATDRFGKDSTLTKYIENLLAYIMSDTISPYAVQGKESGPSLGKVISLNKADALYVDLSKAVNRGFQDDGDGSGWTGSGPNADLRNIPPGMDGITGLVPFKVINPAENDGKSCIVLAGPKGEQFPKESPVIPIGSKCESLFFLQTAMYVKAQPGESILDYEITYDDGSKTVAPMRVKSEIGDWWMGEDYENAKVVYRDGDKTVFATEWINPAPDKSITSIKALSKGNAIPIILGISARSNGKIQNHDRTELNDNRK